MKKYKFNRKVHGGPQLAKPVLTKTKTFTFDFKSGSAGIWLSVAKFKKEKLAVHSCIFKVFTLRNFPKISSVNFELLVNLKCLVYI